MDIRTEYLRQSHLEHDAGQLAVVEVLADLQQRLAASGGSGAGWLSWWRGKAQNKPVQGVYLWGEVGRGKTFLMDLFYATLPLENKRRSHFHRIMSDIHRRLATLSQTENPLDVIAAEMAENVQVLCFDEFYVEDIGDAMILAQLLDALFQRGVTLVATSNSPPAELYRDGLQRSRFLPAIKLLETHTEVVELIPGADYRLRELTQAGTYFVTAPGEASAELSEFFSRVAAAPANPEQACRQETLVLNGRKIHTVRTAEDVVWFDFDALCRGPRSAEDYMEIARCYHTVIVSEVPVLTADDDDAARRFIALVDEFYDRRVNLVLAAAAPIAELYNGSRLSFEFNRTRSRLTEMQSTDYLKAAHLP